MSEEENKTVAQKIQANRLSQELAQVEHNKQREQQRQEKKKQQEAELKDYEEKLAQYEKDQADYQKQLDEYNKAEQELAKQLQEQKAEEEAKKQKEEAHQANLKEITDKYNSQIAELEKQKQEAVSSVPWWHTTTYYQEHSFGSEPGWKTKTVKYTRKQRDLLINKIEKQYNSKINKLKAEKVFDTQSANAYYSGIPAPFIQQALRLHRKYKYSYKKAFKGKTITDTAEAELASFEAQAEHERQSSIKTAQSRAVQEREKLEFTIRDFEQKKEAADKLTKPPNIATQKPLRPAEGKPQPKKLTSFEMRERFGVKPVDTSSAVSIIGTSEAKSKQAVKTFEETEAQQRELYWKITQAPKDQEALQIKTRYQEANPYVGTPQTLLYKGGVVSKEGVLIEKKLSEKFPEGKLESYSPLATAEQELIPTKIQEPQKPWEALPTYQLLDDDGNVIDKPTEADLYRLAIFLTEQKAKTPSKADQVSSKYWEENAEAIAQMEKKGKLDVPSAFPIVDTQKDSFQAGFLGHADELYATVQSIADPEKEVSHKPTLEAQAINDLIEQGKFSLFGSEYEYYGKEKPELESPKVIEEKSKTPEGQLWLAGSIAGSVAFLAGTIILPPIAIAKYGKYIVTPRNLRKAKSIAESVFKKDQDEKFLEARLKEQYPEMPQSKVKEAVKKMTQKPEQKLIEQELTKAGVPESKIGKASKFPEKKLTDIEQKIKKENPEMSSEKVREKALEQIPTQTKETPYTIETINSKTFLITAGSENVPQKTQAILVRFGKKSKSEVYQTVDEKDVLKAKELLVRGKQQEAVKILEASQSKVTSKTPTTKTKKLSEFKKGKSLIKAEEAKKLQKETIEEIGKTEDGKKIVKATGETPIPKQDVFIYPISAKEWEILESPAMGKFLSITGYAKTVSTKDLEKYPKQVITSIEDEPVKQGRLLTETKMDDPIKAFQKEAESLPEPESLIKLEKGTEFPKGPASTTKGTAGGPGKAKSIKDEIDLSIPDEAKPTQTITITKVKETARKVSRAETGSDFYAIETTDFSLSMAGIGLKSIDLTLDKTKVQPMTSAKQISFQESKTKSKESMNEKLNEMIRESDILKEKLKETPEDRLGLTPRWSLIVTPGQIGELDQIPKYLLVPKQEETPRTDVPTDPIRTRPDDPFIPNIPIILPGEKTSSKSRSIFRKLKKSFYAWNVDALQPGYYLPGPELYTGRTTKVYRILERVQKTGSARKSYARKKKKDEVFSKKDTKRAKEAFDFKKRLRIKL